MVAVEHFEVSCPPQTSRFQAQGPRNEPWRGRRHACCPTKPVSHVFPVIQGHITYRTTSKFFQGKENKMQIWRKELNYWDSKSSHFFRRRKESIWIFDFLVSISILAFVHDTNFGNWQRRVPSCFALRNSPYESQNTKRTSGNFWHFEWSQPFRVPEASRFLTEESTQLCHGTVGRIGLDAFSLRKYLIPDLEAELLEKCRQKDWLSSALAEQQLGRNAAAAQRKGLGAWCMFNKEWGKHPPNSQVHVCWLFV